MMWRRFRACLQLLLATALLAASSAASEYHGQVTLNGLPVPGVTIMATQGARTSVATTDTQGVYSFPDLADGTWTIGVQMTGFAPIKQEVVVAPNMPAAKWELHLLSLDQLRAAIKPLKARPEQPAATATTAAPTAKAAETKPQVAANAPMPAPPSDDGLLINGSVNNAATSQYALASSFGNGRPGSKGLYNGNIGFSLENSALDATPFSVTGLDTAKPAYNRFTGFVTVGGPVKIPHLLPRGPNFSLSYQWVRNGSDSSQPALVPDQAERAGNLSELPVQIISPVTGLPYAGNMVPISTQAQALLNFYPLPNLAGSSRYNYQTPLVTDTHQDSLQSRLDKSIGNRNQFFGNFAFQRTRISSTNLFAFVDKTDLLGLTTNVNWQHRFRQRFFMTLGYRFSRLRTQVTPNFENRQNVSANAGISGNDQDPAYWGPPTLTFSSGIASLSDAQSSYNRNETNATSLSILWNRSHHNVTFGGDFRRQEFNYLSQQNPRGTFTFTGQATESSSNPTGTGSDLADFLIGVPDTSSIAYGNADKYFRQSVYDAFVTDDWRVRPELTVNVGGRWEYGAPITELFGRLVNLDVTSGFAAIAPVLGSNPAGPLTNQKYPTSLLRPDKIGFEPRLGVSWRPISGSSVLIKAGYGIYDDTSVYQATALSMAQQAPLSTSLNTSNSPACRFYLSNAFTLPCSSTSTDNFGVDPNFRVGYAQDWQLSVQRDLPYALQMTATYSGIKGTRGVQQFLPNSYPLGASNPCPSCPSDFTYRTSNGNSTREAGIIQLRRRLKNGFTSTLQYTYSKSIDDDAILGGQGPVAAGAASQSQAAAAIAQNWLNLSGERGLSTFDQRNLLTVQVQYTTGQGIGGRTLMTGWKGAVYKEWTFVANFTVGSGLPETPVYLAAVPGAAVCSTCIRPNVTGASIYSAPSGLFLNSAAYSAPTSGQWGDARRDSITGPNQFTFNASMARTFRLKDHYSLDARVDANNALNHVTYSSWLTTVNSTQFGLPTGANGMRTLQATMRLRF